MKTNEFTNILRNTAGQKKSYGSQSFTRMYVQADVFCLRVSSSFSIMAVKKKNKTEKKDFRVRAKSQKEP